MLYSLLENLLESIEEQLTENPTAEKLAKSMFISSVHLRRLFKAAFDMTLASYIRSRRLAASLDKLLNTGQGIVEIADEYGFGHAQSFIRAFKREYGLTPGELRETGRIVNVKPPFRLFPPNQLGDGLSFGPEIVFVPGFYCIGKNSNIPAGQGVILPAKAARDFWQNSRSKIPNGEKADVYIGLTTIPDDNPGYTIYTPSVRVPDLTDIPEGFEGNTFPSCLCARFHYVGRHHPMDVNADIAHGMYDAIKSFGRDEKAKYGLLHKGLFFERIAASDYDGIYCKMEWYTPVREK